MTADPSLSRRALLASGVALSTAIAGCSGGSESADSPNPGTATSEETATPTETGPTLSEFEYPDGATQSGISDGQLYDTHESTVTGAGSLTLDRDTTQTFDGNEFSETETTEFGSAGIYQEVEGSGTTEAVWSPSGEDQSYVQLSSGFDTAYRIDNRAPDNNEATGLEEMRRILEGAAWGEATDVVAAGDSYAVTYEATRVSDSQKIAYGATIESFDATISVTQSGYVRELEYDTALDRDGRTNTTDVTATISSVGETTVEAPEWRDTAAENGIQFTSSLTDAGTAYRLEMVNGSEIASDARLSLSDSGGRGESTLPSPLTTGDVLYVGLSDSNELLIDTAEAPAGARTLQDFSRVDLREGQFRLFVSE